MSWGKERNSEKRDGILPTLSFDCITLFGSTVMFLGSFRMIYQVSMRMWPKKIPLSLNIDVVFLGYLL